MSDEPLRLLRRVVLAPRGGAYELRLVIGRRATLALRGGPDALVARFEQEGQTVAIDLFGAGAPTDDDLARALAQARGYAGLDDDPTGFDALVVQHPTLAKLHRKYRGARLSRRPTVFETFADTVVRQLVTFEEANASLRRLVRRCGEPVPGTELVAFPTAKCVAAVPMHDLRAMGIGMRRARTLLEGAARAPRLEALRDVDPETAMTRIQSLRGVGKWTANTIALHALGHADAVLVGDAVVPFVVTMALTGRAGKDDEMLAALEPYRPHRARVHRLFELAMVLEHEVPGVPRKPPNQIDPHRRFPHRY